jgi:phosphoribosylformylglycinamidine synthase
VSKTNTFILQGKKSFSDSKLEQLNFDFNKINTQNAEISSNEIYILASKNQDLNLDDLKNILNANDSLETFSFLVGPRSGTISPWSSKTEDIIKNVGIQNVTRVEKFYGIHISNFSKDADLDLSMFFDRMTQSIYFDYEDCKDFLNIDPQRAVSVIDIIGGGLKTLQDANKSFGFAMSNDEIEYLYDFYSKVARNPTDAELMMFAQANSEHCRHKIFNAKWTINGASKNNSLFDLIKETSKQSPNGIISAYKDNAAITEGEEVERLHLDDKNDYTFVQDKLNSTIKVETHNHPTAISPYPGAATGSGGEIRDEGATGRGAKPKIGLVGFNVSNLRIPNLERSWEGDEHKPERIASPLNIMIEAPIGAAAFNNEFGRPSTLGYFRSYETEFNSENKAFGYHKPIMLAGGIGEIRDRNNFKLQITEDYHVVVLGGPAMLIGLGGGAASSVSSGDSDEDLDFASVQRDNAEMERRCQEVINICSSQDDSFIEFIHDVGAGGLSNAIPELAKDSDLGVYIELDKIPNSDKSMSPMEIWSNESQERYVLAVHPENKEAFENICKRERCVYAFVGVTTSEKSVKLFDSKTDSYPVNVPYQCFLVIYL